MKRKEKRKKHFFKYDIKLFPTLNPNATNRKKYMQKRRKHIIIFCGKVLGTTDPSIVNRKTQLARQIRRKMETKTSNPLFLISLFIFTAALRFPIRSLIKAGLRLPRITTNRPTTFEVPVSQDLTKLVMDSTASNL